MDDSTNLSLLLSNFFIDFLIKQQQKSELTVGIN